MSEIQPVASSEESASRSLSVFSTHASFELAQRQAKLLAAADILPPHFRGSIPNCLIALNIAHRLGVDPYNIFQNMFVVHGKPSWSASFLIGLVNSSGRFSLLQHKLTGQGDDLTCVAWAKHLDSGDIVEGPPVSIGMAKKEGWYNRNGSKWQTMPDLMLRYRSSAFFARLYCPDICLGLRTDDEEKEIREVNPPAKLFDAAPPSKPLPVRPANLPDPEPVEVEVEIVIPEPEPEPEPDPRTVTLTAVLELITQSEAKAEDVENVLKRKQLLSKTGTVARLGNAKLMQIQDEWLEIESLALNPGGSQTWDN